MREGQTQKNDMLEKALLQAAHSSPLGIGFGDIAIFMQLIHTYLYNILKLA